jgi:rod shape-determining protein MreB
MVTKIGLDLGYSNITISDVSMGIYREPSIALINKETRRIVSVGSKAVSAEEAKATDEGVLVRPFKNGLLFDRQITEGILENAISAILPAERVRCVIGVPSDILPKQERELFRMMHEAGVTDCYSVNRAMAALIGAGYSPLMSVISVNVGASATEIIIIYRGQIIYAAREEVGGEDFDKAVRNYILEQGDVNISLSVARAIKERLGAVWQGRESEEIEIEGTLSLTGNKVRMSVTTEDIVGVFEKPVHKLLLAIAEGVKKIPIDMVEEIFENGIVLSGGGSLIYGLDVMANKVLGIPVTQPEDPLDSVAKGLSRINSYIPMRIRSNNKNITLQIAKYYESRKT